MVKTHAMNARLQQRLCSLGLQEKTALRNAAKKVRTSFQKLRQHSYEYHYTRMAATVLQELFDFHETLHERTRVPVEEKPSLERKCIASYVGFKMSGNTSQYYVLSPSTVKGRQSCSLSRHLAAHVRTSIKAAHLSLGCTNPDESMRHCFPHPFLFYQCNASQRYVQKFHDSFLQFIEKSQPNQFTAFHLRHHVETFSQEALRRLKHRDWEEIFRLEEQLVTWESEQRQGISYAELAPVIDMGAVAIKRLVSRGEFSADGPGNVSLQSLKSYYDLNRYLRREALYRVRNKLNLQSADLEERKREALSRLAEQGETLTFRDIASVLGISYMSAKELSRVESRENRWANITTSRGRGHIARIPKPYIQQYIEAHTPLNRGWSSHPLAS